MQVCQQRGKHHVDRVQGYLFFGYQTFVVREDGGEGRWRSGRVAVREGV